MSSVRLGSRPSDSLPQGNIAGIGGNSRFSRLLTQENPTLLTRWRRERDSNPRYLAGKAVFKTACFNHSHIPPQGDGYKSHLQDIILALAFTRIAREEALRFQLRTQVGVELKQGAGNAVADGAGLAVGAAAGDVDADVQFVRRAGDGQRLSDRVRRVSAGNRFQTARPLTVILPVPVARRTRAMAVLRRPVPRNSLVLLCQ